MTALPRLPGPVPRRVGLLGGSFNPAHEGHRHISLEAMKRLGLDEVWWLVSPQNPLKPAKGMAGLARRLNRAAEIANHPRIRVSALETRLKTRYTADTLAALVRLYPRTRFVWLMGSDNLAQFPRWRKWQEIRKTVAIAVLDREGYLGTSMSGRAARTMSRDRLADAQAKLLPRLAPPAWVRLIIRRHPASATAIRRRGDWT